MSSTTAPKTPNPAPLPEEQGSDFDLLTWFELNRKPILVAVAALIVAGVTMMVVRTQRRAAHENASTELLALRPPTKPGDAATPPAAADLIRLAETHAGTSAAERARLLAAGRLFSEGKYAEARAQFDQLERDFPQTEFASIAALGIASSLDAENKTNEAITAYQRVIGAFATSPAATQAKLAKAGLHVAAGQAQQALAIYDDLMKSQTMSQALQEAAMARARLLAAHPELDKPLIATNAITITPTNQAPATP